MALHTGHQLLARQAEAHLIRRQGSEKLRPPHKSQPQTHPQIHPVNHQLPLQVVRRVQM